MNLGVMAKDITKPVEEKKTVIVEVKVVFEKIILVANKKVGSEDVQYLQINIQKLPKNRNVSDECSEHLSPTSMENSEIIFVLTKELGEFELDLRQDVLIESSQYEVELEIMRKGERKVIGSFDIRLCDIEPQSSKKTKWRKIQPQIKAFQTIELKYKVFPCQDQAQPVQNNNCQQKGHITNVVEYNVSTTDNNPFGSTDTETPEVSNKMSPSHEMSPRHKMSPKYHVTPIFKPRSCIVVSKTPSLGNISTRHITYTPLP